jgi:hypothetical protein
MLRICRFGQKVVPNVFFGEKDCLIMSYVYVSGYCLVYAVMG